MTGNSNKKHQRLSANVMKIMSVFGGVQVFNILCSIIRTKCVALWAGAIGVGLFGIYNSAIDLISTFTMFGVTSSSVRDIAANERSGQKWTTVAVVRRFGWMLGILGAMTIMLSSRLLSEYSFGDNGHTFSFMLLGICLFLNAVTNINLSIMQALRQFKALANASVWGAAGGVVISVPMFYFWHVDSIIPALIGFSTVGFISMWISRRRSTSVIQPVEITWHQTFTTGRNLIVLGFFLMLSSASGYGVNYLFLSWLSREASVDEVGLYQAGFTLFNRYAGIIFTAIGMEYFPRLSSASASLLRTRLFVNHESSLILFLILPMTALFILTAPLIVKLLYSADFISIVPMVTIGICGTAMRGVSWCLAFVMLTRNDGRIYMWCEISSAIVSLALNVAGYKLAGLTGLGAAYVAWYLFYIVLVAIICSRRYEVRLNRGVISLTILTCVIGSMMAILAIATGLWWINALTACAVSIISARRILTFFRR